MATNATVSQEPPDAAVGGSNPPFEGPHGDQASRSPSGGPQPPTNGGPDLLLLESQRTRVWPLKTRLKHLP